MKANNKWWTLQFVPHGKGKVKSYRIKKLPIILAISFFTFLMISGLGLSYYLWNVTKLMDAQLDARLDHIDQYKVENSELKYRVQELNTDLIQLHEEVNDMQDWLKEVQQLEEEVRDLESTSTISASKNQTSKSKTLTVSSLIIEKDPENAEGQTIHAKLEQLKKNVASEMNELTSLKEEIEREQYLAQFIPSIPPSNGRITSRFGWRRDPFHGRTRLHEGLDFADSYRSPIYATARGTVIYAARNGGYGKQIRIDHGNGYITTYSHLTSFTVSKGDKVKKGDVIARMGSTGRSTGVHLHYEVHKYGKSVNPISYIKGGKSFARKKSTN